LVFIGGPKYKEMRSCDHPKNLNSELGTIYRSKLWDGICIDGICIDGICIDGICIDAYVLTVYVLTVYVLTVYVLTVYELMHMY